MSPGCGGFGGPGVGLVGVPGAWWAAGTCSVPHLPKPQSDQDVSQLWRDTAAPPGVLGPGQGAHRDGTAGVPPRDGDRALKAKFGFFLFFPFPFVMVMIFTVT